MKYTVTLGLVAAMSSVCFGTTQFSEKLVDEYCDERDMASTPLEDYFSTDQPRPTWLKGTSSACRRGYIGAWEIREESLFLNSLYRNVGPRLEEKEPIPLKNLFGDSGGPVRAEWFSGVLRVLDGKRKMSMGFSPVNERDLFISVVCGKVIGKRTVDNTSGGEWSWSDQSWHSLTTKPRKTHESLQPFRDADLEEEDWLDGRQLYKRAKDLRDSQATFNVRGLSLGTKLWTPPIGIGKNQNRDQYEFVRGGLNYYLDYVPNIDIAAESHSRMIGTTVEITARFRGNYRTDRDYWTLLVSKVTQLPSGAAIQMRRQSIEKKAGASLDGGALDWLDATNPFFCGLFFILAGGILFILDSKNKHNLKIIRMIHRFRIWLYSGLGVYLVAKVFFIIWRQP